jgi:hypothetical protein
MDCLKLTNTKSFIGPEVLFLHFRFLVINSQHIIICSNRIVKTELEVQIVLQHHVLQCS